MIDDSAPIFICTGVYVGAIKVGRCDIKAAFHMDNSTNATKVLGLK